MRRLEVPPLWLLGFVALAWVQTRLVPLPFFGVAGDVAGWLLVAAGGALLLIPVAQMLAGRTTVDPHGQPARLMTGGLFRLSRNPIYLGDTLMLTGFLLIMDAPLALPLVPLFVWIVTHRFILPEEARLRSIFGAEFEAFCARTRRWV